MDKMVILVLMEHKALRETLAHPALQELLDPQGKLDMAQLDLRYVCCMYAIKKIGESDKSLFRVVLAGQVTLEHVVMLDQKAKVELKDTPDLMDLK